ncbi:MAG TPA: tRNA (adenosine(37)-N6)-threonylcarbamoyltransferase complex dimerization subunit type 1 TsaB [Pseudonocardiaceae bacterium]|nr:tRNA (adenosine(37)-N6)-threonylcarbamoyltransferase complex dimerization subunit type 1 TsaB [Pseudonocardiaceae bacterium]
MIVLAVDTATPAVTAGVVELTDSAAAPAVLAERVTVDARAHGELLTPHIQDALRTAGVPAAELTAVVVGAGPGPFTGLRVGLVTAAAFGHALEIPVHPVCSLDAIAAELPDGPSTLVVTDARRREVYWAAYDPAGARTHGPAVAKPAEVADKLAELGVARAAGAGAAQYAEALGLPVAGPQFPGPRGLVAVAAAALRAGAEPAPLTPLYLRRPDATVPGAPKQVRT